MKKHCLITAILGLVLLGYCHAADDNSDSGIDLRNAVKFAKNQTYSSDVTVKSSFEDDSTVEPDTFSMQMTFKTFLQDLDENQHPTHYACTPTKGEIGTPHGTQAITKDNIKTSHVTLNKQGTWDSIAEGEDYNQGPLSHVFVLCQSPVLVECLLPEKPVKPGDTWQLDTDAITCYAKMLAGPILRDIDLNEKNWTNQGKLAKLENGKAVVMVELNATVHAQDNFPVELEVLAVLTVTIDTEKAMVSAFQGEVTMNMEDTQVKRHASMKAEAEVKITLE